MDHWIERFREAKPAPGFEKVLIPGDPERETEAAYLENGIPLVEAVQNDLKELGHKFHVEFPAS